LPRPGLGKLLIIKNSYSCVFVDEDYQR